MPYPHVYLKHDLAFNTYTIYINDKAFSHHFCFEEALMHFDWAVEEAKELLKEAK